MLLTRKLSDFFLTAAVRLGILDGGDIDSLVDKRKKSLVMRFIHDHEHFVKQFLRAMPIWLMSNRCIPFLMGKRELPQQNGTCSPMLTYLRSVLFG